MIDCFFYLSVFPSLFFGAVFYSKSLLFILFRGRLDKILPIKYVQRKFIVRIYVYCVYIYIFCNTRSWCVQLLHSKKLTEKKKKWWRNIKVAMTDAVVINDSQSTINVNFFRETLFLEKNKHPNF